MQTIIANGLTEAANSTTRFDSADPISLNHENGSSNRELVDALANSKIYKEYERAFGDLTGLPIALQPVETW
jgi:hypothetical protein